MDEDELKEWEEHTRQLAREQFDEDEWAESYLGIEFPEQWRAR